MAALLCCGYACKPAIKETGAQVKFFDIKEYFQHETTRLTKPNHEVNKSVDHNGDKESKKVKISNWARELNLFTESDINKPAWSKSYTVDSTATNITYKAKYPELKTRYITICRENGKVTAIEIENDTQNILYNTTEKLTYLPGTFYQIEKMQHVKVMGGNSYKIKGEF
ncbi:hypothetical protein [Mucilaginibacter glaciei]|uniref:Uncharacterized protein n=1 Tax=Mucilaginibacter glaciei TaxID=2772109 RepID=A0A926NR88_9SPHI|nr:hypothetical protein [Mucilaginibacter glaciei]MBD1394546.1 hypothetical protein [Mucilaginibacter glaciei]